MTSSIGTFQELQTHITLDTPIAADFLTPSLVKELFQEMRRGIAPASPRIQNKIWNQLLLNTGLSERSLYKAENVKRLVLGYRDEDYTLIQREEEALGISLEGASGVKKIIHYLLSDRNLSQTDISKKVLSAVLLFRNKGFLAEAINEIQRVFRTLHEKLSSEDTAETKKAHELLLGNALALLPFFEPREGTIIQVPQKIDDSWILFNYTITPIALTPTWMGSPFYCYGLKAEGAPPLLLLQGTTYPASSGAIWTYWTDTIPFMSVGESVYRLGGKEKIAAWLEGNKGQKAHLYGQSLGGSLSVMTACDYPEQVSEVHAYGSPSPFFRFVHTYSEKTKAVREKPKVNLYQQEGDIVPILGWGWHNDWNISTIVGEKKFSPIPAHAKAFTGQKCFIIMNVKGEIQQTRIQRIAFNIFHQFLSIPLCIIWSLIILVKIITIMPLYFALEAIYECFRNREAQLREASAV